jgi:hypothetical protein
LLSDILEVLLFHPDHYGPEAARILALDGCGARPMPLFPRSCASEKACRLLLSAKANEMLPGARDASSALGGLLLYFSCLTEAHDVVQAIPTADGAYWHGIMHRMEGDAFNAGHWFRRMGPHPIFPSLHREAAQLGYEQAPAWDPLAFIRFCEPLGKSPGGETDAERLAKEIQLAEWQLLFDYCARPVRDNSDASEVRTKSGEFAR